MVDALINYLSALTYARPSEDLRDRYWPEVRHLIAKDILRFHCVFWPALLFAADYPPPKQLFVHGYLQIGGRKISKSLGNVIDPLDLLDIYGVDPVRFYVARVTTFGQDGNASVEDFHERYERELGNDLGNLVSRTTAMIARYRDGTVSRAETPGPVDLDALGGEVARRLDAWDLSGALEEIWSVIRELNRYVEASAPWQLAKDESRAAELDAVLYHLVDGLSSVAVALAPYLPETAPIILAALAQPADLAWSRIANSGASPARGITAAEPLFPRVDVSAFAAA
jgi:methionyl-tRNA synthetase